MPLSGGRKPRVFNTDQGNQHTSKEWTKAVEGRGITISVDGKGRWADNIVMERFWRTYKYDFFHQPNGKTPLADRHRLICPIGWPPFFAK